MSVGITHENILIHIEYVDRIPSEKKTPNRALITNRPFV